MTIFNRIPENIKKSSYSREELPTAIWASIPKLKSGRSSWSQPYVHRTVHKLCGFLQHLGELAGMDTKQVRQLWPIALVLRLLLRTHHPIGLPAR